MTMIEPGAGSLAPLPIGSALMIMVYAGDHPGRIFARTLSNVAMLGGTGEVSGPRHGDRVAKLMHFHRQYL
jgi:hypothetical protein